MDIQYRPVTEAEFDAFARVGRIAFSQERFPSDMPWTFGRAELDRTVVATWGDEIVGTGRNYSFELTLPGGAVVPAAGVSWITVMPTFRRRGVLRTMMATLDAEARSRGEAFSILTASEGGIYTRFGYGVATWRTYFHVDNPRAARMAPRTDDGRLRYLERDEALERFPDVYARACRLRAGMVSRPDAWWPESLYNIALPNKATFFVAHEDAAGVIDGFLTYEVMGDFALGITHRPLQVTDLITLNPHVRALLWQFAFSVDLVESVSAVNMAVDEPLRFLLDDVRSVRVDAVNDHLWLKILDLPRALEARRYATTDQLVLEVHDGADVSTVVLDGSPEGATCRPTTVAPDLVLGTSQLGSIFLGGTRASQHAAAGAVEERTGGALARIDAMFASYPVPASPTWF